MFDQLANLIDSIDNVVGSKLVYDSYHQWFDRRKALEASTLFKNVRTTWFIKQEALVKDVWPSLKQELIQNFAHNNITQTTL
jgi:hypothetical protein